MATLPTTPLFRDLDADALRDQYRQWRTLAHRSADIATRPGGAGRTANARQMGRIMRNVQLIERIADSKGINLHNAA
jgi:hypothetical protein